MTILKTDENPGLQVFYQGAHTKPTGPSDRHRFSTSPVYQTIKLCIAELDHAPGPHADPPLLSQPCRQVAGCSCEARVLRRQPRRHVPGAQALPSPPFPLSLPRFCRAVFALLCTSCLSKALPVAQPIQAVVAAGRRLLNTCILLVYIGA